MSCQRSPATIASLIVPADCTLAVEGSITCTR